MTRFARWGRRAGAALAVLLVFWVAGLAVSRFSGPETLPTSVHGLALGDYQRSAPQRLAPLSHRIIEDARRDTAAARPAPGSSPPPTRSPAPSPTETPASPTPSPEPSLPIPTPTPIPTVPPTPTPPPVLTGTVQGVVRNAATSTGIAGALVDAGSASTQTDSSGVYRFSLPAGAYSVTASAVGYASQTQSATVLPSMTVPLNFALSPTVISGLVLDATSCAVRCLGIPNATVSLRPGGMTTTTDATGAFSFTVNPGPYTVTASAPTYQPAGQMVTVLAGQRASVVLKLSH